MTFTARPAMPTFLGEQLEDAMTQGVGEDLINMGPADLRLATVRYLDRGVNIIKYGATTYGFKPAFILFSPRAQQVIVEEAQRRGMAVDTRATTSEGMRLVVLAGVDVVQHPEQLDGERIPDELVKLLIERNGICSMNVRMVAGEQWASRAAQMNQSSEWMEREMEKHESYPPTAREGHQTRRSARMAVHRENAERLIAAGCNVSVATGAVAWLPEQFHRWREKRPQSASIKVETLDALIALVELAMSPMQALVSGTRNGTLASRALADYGTIETGKIADLPLLAADPTADIANIKKQMPVMETGDIVNTVLLLEGG